MPKLIMKLRTHLIELCISCAAYYSMQNGAFKGYKSYDSGSTWSLIVSGTHAAYADMTRAFAEMNKRTGSGNKIALLDADPYKYDIVL